MKSKFTASNTGIARIGTYDSFVEENDGKPVDIGYALNLITSDDLAFKAVAMVDKLPSPKDAAPGLFYQLDKDFYTLNSKEDGFDKVILGADTTLGLTNNLQQQIDTLEAASDVADVVGTKAELDSYPTENLTDRAIVEVMRDESQSDATAYYRYDLESKSFSLVGVLGIYYTKSEADAKFATEEYVDAKVAENQVNIIAPLTTTSTVESGDDHSLAIGPATYSYSGNKDIEAPYSIAIGKNIRVTGGGKIIGDNPNDVQEVMGIVIGSGKTRVGTPTGISIGHQQNFTSTGTTNNNFIAIGDMQREAKGAGSISIGRLVGQTGSFSVAIGDGATCRAASSVALGDETENFRDKTVSVGSRWSTRAITGVADPTEAQDAATKNYVDTQLTPINAKLQYVPENTNQVLSQIETNVEKAQSAADAKVASITAGTGISITGAATTPTISVNSEYITQQINNAISSLQSTVDNLNEQIEAINSTLATLNERVSALENPDTGASS